MTNYVTKTSDLDAEFKISKNTRVTRLAAIGLHPDRLHKEGKAYWLTQAQYDLFIDFDRYIQETGSTKDYPNLYTSYSESEPLAADECGELATVATAQMSHDSSQSDAFDDTFTRVFPSSSAPGDTLATKIIENAQNRAAATLLAESILADRYLQNPDSLPAELRAQIDSIPIRSIDPKELAASLIRGVENIVNFGEAA